VLFADLIQNRQSPSTASLESKIIKMNQQLRNLLSKLESFGVDNDAAIAERPKRMLNITRDTGEFLSILIKASKAKNILGIGTSNGYSTLWLADAAQANNGHITTIEYADYKAELALNNFTEAGLDGYITLIKNDAALELAKFQNGHFDFIFLDSERSEYLGWLTEMKRTLKVGGLLVVDNAVSHSTEMLPLMNALEADSDFSTNLVPIGNGEFLAYKES